MIKKTRNDFATLVLLMKEFLWLLLLSVAIFYGMGYINHSENQIILASFLIIFSVVKVYVLISKTLVKMKVLIKDDYSMNHLLFFSVIIIFIINISFTLDYLCVSEIYPDSFRGLKLNQPFFFKFFDVFYFSVVTFTTVGYGDIVPAAKIVKFLTMLEMATAFITIVFIISRHTKNHEKSDIPPKD